MKNSKVLKYCVPNEHICAEIGRYLCLPIPPSGLCYLKGHDPEDWFASLNFNLTSSSLPPIDPAKTFQLLPFESTGLILFDILIGNGDRHRNNFSVDFSLTPPRMSVFDHSHALFGHQNGKGSERLNNGREDMLIGGHCLLAFILNDKHFGEWISRINSLPDYLIDQACEATVPLGMITTAEALSAQSFLKHRRQNIKNIVTKNQTAFTAVTSWTLI